MGVTLSALFVGPVQPQARRGHADVSSGIVKTSQADRIACKVVWTLPIL
ncbi:hypothetical protein [Duganella callida]|nr:hypothetical protein [Duganella callida]